MTNYLSSVHRAIQDVRHGVLYSKFVEKKGERSDYDKGHSDFVTELCSEPVFKK